jgi:hypothetical protein
MLLMMAIGSAGCAHSVPRLFAPPQPDGWSAQPIPIARRFTHDAELHCATRTPVGDAGYYLYILTSAAAWDYASTRSFISSHARQPWGHSWLILENPTNRFECGLNGNLGLEQPKYADGVSQRFRNGDPDPVSYLWTTMSDGELQLGSANRAPTFVWRLPITRRQHHRIQNHVLQWKFDQIGVSSNNCVDLVAEAATLAGIGLMHRIRLTLPSQTRIWGKTLRVWTDPKYQVLEYSTPDVLEVDLRHLARLGIGCDVTKWYRNSDMAASKAKDGGKASEDCCEAPQQACPQHAAYRPAVGLHPIAEGKPTTYPASDKGGEP